jgi:predicted amino acid-binding ACT domain protein
VAREALKDRDKLKKRDREFRFPTHITFDNEGSDIYTIIEVDTRDRPGLLYDLTRTLAANNIYIASAVIATYGAQVVDTFYVKDMFGLKLHQKHKQEALDRKLRAAIAEGAERAQACTARSFAAGKSPRMKPVRIVKGFLTVGFWTLVSRVAGLVRDIFLAKYLGDGPVAQAFVIAQSLPNMFRRFFAEGAFNFAFVPMFAKKVEAGEDAEAFARDAFWGMAGC